MFEEDLLKIRRAIRAGRADLARGPLLEIQRALERGRRKETALEAEIARYRLLLDRTLRVTLAEGIRPVAEEVLDGMMAVLSASRGFVGLSRPGGWDFLVARNLAQSDIADPAAQVSTTIIEQALASGEMIVTDDAAGDFDAAASIRRLSLRSVACLPLLSEGRSVGFVYLDDPDTLGLFDAAALAALQGWAPLVAGCVARASVETVQPALPGVITRSPQLLADLRELARIAGFEASVLLTGETGTGKSLIARRVHAASPRAERPFVHVNCGAIPESLIEGELFGAEPGAYTGSRARRIGKFEAAAGGTLFLDELDSMPLSCQVRLLVALQERTITRLGGNEPVSVDVRVIAALGRDPFEAIAAGALREDLYYRLAVFVARLPPLRERMEDVPLLARHALERVRDRYGLPPIALSADAERALMAHRWPGNVRELENALDRAALLARDGQIASLSLDRRPGAPAAAGGPDRGPIGAVQHAAAQIAAAMIAREDLRDLKAVAVMKGAVLLALRRRLGGLEAAFRLVGQDEQVRGRNHHRAFRRETGRLKALAEKLGEPVDLTGPRRSD